MGENPQGPTYPRSLEQEEAKEIRRRREAAGCYPQAAPSSSTKANGADKLPRDAVGVAFSGGGIRSATFCLGVLRALARQHLVGRIDFLSTVSGGGYLGSFLGGLFTPRPSQSPRPTVADVERDLLNLRSKPVDWLRENGRYMSPNGAGDTLLAGAILLRNWVAVMVVVSSFLFALLATTAWLARAALAWWPTALAWAQLLDRTIFPKGFDPARVQVVLSPYVALPVVLLLAAVIPLGWAYWFTQRFGFSARRAKFPPFLFAAALIVAVLLSGWRGRLRGQLLVFVAAAALAWWLLAWVTLAFAKGGDSAEPLMRNRLSRCLSGSLWAGAALLLFSVVDTLGRALVSSAGRAVVWKATLSVGATLVGTFAFAQKVLPALGALGGNKRLTPKPQLLIGSLAVAVAVGLLIGIAALAHSVDPAQLGWTAVCSALIAAAAAWTIPFLNLSSHNSLYGARLTRAYLGASNLTRQGEQTTVTELLPDDRISLANYDPPGAGGPLHLLNVTVNETVSGKSQLEQRDRKGLGMSIGPCGISVGRRHHALWAKENRGRALASTVTPEGSKDFEIFPAQKENDPPIKVEELDLGAWISISGAAFTTGLGARTSLSLSLLLGLANVRLGYWWDCGISPSDRDRGGSAVRETRAARLGRWFSQLLPVHAYLLDELLARFHGPGRQRWYLSDGGHSENTGAYELIRRRVPFIVICDAGCDPGYQFADLANLARRVRTDFNAELALFTRAQLDQVLPADLAVYFGSVQDFTPKPPGGRPHALLAGVFYDDPLRERSPGSVVLILKPALSGDEPLDVAQYQSEHPSFPQEPTSDQFFDEAQWESYRRLGEHVASRVFEDVQNGWRPLDFCPPPTQGLRWRGANRKLGNPPDAAASGVHEASVPGARAESRQRSSPPPTDFPTARTSPKHPPRS